MPATEAELTYARSYIGTTETDDVFNERVDRLALEYDDRADVIDASIEESIRAQLSSMMLDQPGQASAPGGVSYSNGANIQTLAQQLTAFQKGGGSSAGGRGIHVGRLVRERRR